MTEVSLALEKPCKKTALLPAAVHQTPQALSFKRSGCFDKQAGEGPWIGSAEEDFSQVGQNEAPSRSQRSFFIII